MRNETAWLAWAQTHGVPATTDAELPTGMQPCYRVMQTNPGSVPQLMTALGQLQAWIHRQPATDAPGPVLDWSTAMAWLVQLADEADEAGGEVHAATVRRMERMLAGLDPGPPNPVPCHGELTPVTVHLDPDDHHQVSLSGWSGAVLSDPAYDLSCTEVSLWATPYLTPLDSERGMATLTRNFVINCHRAGYRGVADLPDSRRMRLWGAFHTARVFASPLSHIAPFNQWEPTIRDGVLKLMREDLAARLDELVDGLPAEAMRRGSTTP